MTDYAPHFGFGMSFQEFPYRLMVPLPASNLVNIREARKCMDKACATTLHGPRQKQRKRVASSLSARDCWVAVKELTYSCHNMGI